MPHTPYLRTSKTTAAGPAIAMVLGLAGAGAYAQIPADPIERDMYFVERSADATELYNAQKYAEALPVFESLVQFYADLDTDGFVMLGYGDCLAALGRVNEARAVYHSAMTPDPRRQEAVRNRLEELQLKGPITAAILDELRVAAQQNLSGRFTSAWRLGRALQKRAADLLAEAAQAFRSAAEGPGEKPCSARQLNNQAIYLDELVNDLKFLIDEVEGHLNIPTNIGPPAGGTEPLTQDLRVEQTLQLPDGRRVRIEIEQHAGSCVCVKVDGKDVQLTGAEQQLLRRHQDRTSAIILKAEGRPGSAAQALPK